MALNMSAQERLDAGENPLTAVPGGFTGSLANLAKRKITDPIKNWWDAPRPTAGDFAEETTRRYQPSGAGGDVAPGGLAAPVANLNWQQPVTPIDQPGLVAPTAAAGNLTWPSDTGRQTINSGNIPLATKKIKNGLQTVGARSRTPLQAPTAAVGTSPTVPNDAPWPQLPGVPPQAFTPVAGTDNIRTMDADIQRERISDIKGLTIPSGGGIATMGDQTALLRGGNSVPQAENDRVIAAREQQFAPQKTLVGSGLSAPRLVGPGEEAFAPDFSRMDTGQLMTNLLERKVANRDAKIAQEAQTAQSQVGLNAANVNHLNTESNVALGMVPYNQAHLTSTDNYQNAHAKVALGMLPVNQNYTTAHARLANSTADATEYANSPEGRAEAQGQQLALIDAKKKDVGQKDFADLVKGYSKELSGYQLPRGWDGKREEVARMYAMNADPQQDYGIYFNPGTANRMGIGVSRKIFEPYLNKYRQKGISEKDVFAHAVGDLQTAGSLQGKKFYEDVPNIENLYQKPTKPGPDTGITFGQ